MNHRACVELPPVYLITDRKIAVPDLSNALESALKGGIRLVQLREKDLNQKELRSLAEKILKIIHYYGARLLLNADPELAAQLGADGVQLGVNSCDIKTARRILGPNALIGYSAHSANEVQSAAEQSADFVTFSPIYYTTSKAKYGPPQGIDALREISQRSSIPVYALGGINCNRINEVINAGASGVACISAILNTPDVLKASQQFLQTINTSLLQVER